MATEFDDAAHYALFKGQGAIRTGNSFEVRWSEITLAALRSAGFLDNMIDGLTPPAIDKLWLDKNTDPATLKEWDPVGANWQQVSNQTLFGRVPWRGAWATSPVYRRADLVSYQGNIWIAIQPSQNRVPVEGPYWNLFLPSLADESVSPVKLVDGIMPFDSIADFQAGTVHPSISNIRTAGYYAPGDGGGAQYVRLSAAPGVVEPWHKQSADGAWWELKEAIVTPQMFGAKGDGVADDTAALVAAMRYGKGLDFGGAACVYRFVTPIVLTITFRLQWKASGATLVYDGVVAQRAIHMLLPAASHTLRGRLTIDANRKAFVGFRANNAPGTIGDFPNGFPDLIVTDLAVKNVHRASTAFTEGDGIYISGAFNKVHLTRPDVRNCTMATGAGVSGSQGIFGITIADDSNGSPYDVKISEPYIDLVMSDDNTYLSDQDGIRVFADYSTGGAKPSEASFRISGGVIRNCRNRSIKSQMQNGFVDGVKLIKIGTVVDPGNVGAGSQADIELQVGGGQVSDIEFHYDSFVPPAVVRFTESVNPAKVTSMPNISGIRGVVLGAILPAVTWTVGTANNGSYRANIDDINVSGQVNVFHRMTGATGTIGAMLVNLSNAFAQVLTAAVTMVSGGVMEVNLIDVKNTGSTTPPLLDNASGNTSRPVSCLNVRGFADARALDAITGGMAATRVKSIAPEGSSASGTLRPFSFEFGDGQTVDLPNHGFFAGVHMLLLSVGNNNLSQGIFAVSGAGVIALTPEATGIVVGTTSEPASGAFRLWAVAGAGPKISNRSGTTRRIFGIQIG